MLDVRTFNRLLLLPTFVLFHAVGLAPFHQCYTRARGAASSRLVRRLLRAQAVAIVVLVVLLTVFVIVRKIDITNANVNELIDQWLMLGTLFGHLIMQTEALLTADRQRCCCRRLYAALRFAAASAMAVRTDVGRLAAHQALHTWTPFAVTAVGIAAVCVVNHEWSFLSWMAVSRLVMHVRILQLAVYVEWLGVLQAAQIRALQRGCGRGRAADDGGRQRCELLAACLELYARTAEMAADVGACFGWSLLVLMVHSLLALVNGAYWTMVNVFALRMGNITLCECGGGCMEGEQTHPSVR